MAALDLDFLTRVTNVHWGGGLAVDFLSRPSYVALAHDLGDMRKAVISLWFRIPDETAQQVRARDAGPNVRLNSFPDPKFVVPLLTFGPQSMGLVYETGLVQTSERPVVLIENIGPPPIITYEPIYSFGVTGSHNEPMLPSCIGVKFDPQDDPAGRLFVHIQTADMASGTKLATTSYSVWVPVEGGTPVEGHIETTHSDATYIKTAAPMSLGNSYWSGSGTGFPPDSDSKITTDRWHHLIISWDLLGNQTHGLEDGGSVAEGTSAYSLMWCALDDVNRDKYDLPAVWVEDGPNSNAHLCGLAYEYAGDFGAEQSVSVTFANVPSNPLVLPSPATLLHVTDEAGGSSPFNANQEVQLAELQIFTGTTLDTSNVINRRAFIDFQRDLDGNPSSTLKPVDPKIAEAWIGKRPEILLHGTTKWQDGKNTGSIGIDADGEEIPSGQFSPTGTITKYTPDPSIE